MLQVVSDDGEAEKVLLLKMAGGFKLGKMLSVQGCGFMDLVLGAKLLLWEMEESNGNRGWKINVI